MSMVKLEKQLSRVLNVRKQNGTLRALSRPESGLIDFSSNDYLGLAAVPFPQELEDDFVANGATGSRLA